MGGTSRWRDAVQRGRRPGRARVLLGGGLAVALALVVAHTSAASPAPQLPTLPAGGIDAATGELDLNVRAAPGLAQPIIGTLPPGTRVLVVGGPLLIDDWVWCEHASAAGRGWSVCLGLEGAQYLAAGVPPPPAPVAAGPVAPAGPTAPAGGGTVARPAQGPPPPPAMTPVRLPLPGQR